MSEFKNYFKVENTSNLLGQPTLKALDFPMDSAADPTAFAAPSAFLPMASVNSPAFLRASFLPTSSKVVLTFPAMSDSWVFSALELLLISPSQIYERLNVIGSVMYFSSNLHLSNFYLQQFVIK